MTSQATTAGLVADSAISADLLPGATVRPSFGADMPVPHQPRTPAGQRALRRRRARLSSARGPLSGVLPSTDRGSAVVSADHGFQVADRPIAIGRWTRLLCTASFTATVVVLVLVMCSPSTAPATVRLTVAPGDTLWSLARRADPDADPRGVVDQIRRINLLSGDAIAVGVVLTVPTGVR